MELIVWSIIGSLIFFAVLYLVIKGAVEEGTYNALIKYEKDKEQVNKNNS